MDDDNLSSPVAAASDVSEFLDEDPGGRIALIVSWQGEILGLTPAAISYWSVPDERSLIGTSLLELMPEATWQIFQRVFEEGLGWEGTFEAGGPKAAVLRGSLTPLIAGTKARYWLLNARALESSVEVLLGSIRAPSLFVDQAGLIVSINAAFSELFGYEARELMQQPISLLVPEMQRAQHAMHFERFSSELTKNVAMGGFGDLQGRRSDGALIMFRASIARHCVDGHAGFLMVVDSVDEKERFRRMLRWNERHDLLTGLPNRKAMLEQLESFVAASVQGGTPFSLLLVDIDRFNEINETLGPLIGDEVLRTVAARMHRHAGANVRIGRLASDEFLLISDVDISPESVRECFDRLSDDVRQPIQLSGRRLSLSVSAGAQIVMADGSEASELLRTTQLALRHAKLAGRERLRFFDDELDRLTQRQAAIRSGLISESRFDTMSIAVQPIVDAMNGGIVGAEVLLRWQIDQKPVSPADFIPVAEETGAIHDLGLWVFERTCELARRLLDELGKASPWLSVNVSPRQLDDDDLPHKFASIAHAYGVNADMIMIEITETALMAHLEDNLSVLERLKALGFRCSIDDFGTGHSSLAQLLKMPAEKLKIDRVFIDDVDIRPDSRTIVSASIKLARELKMRVVAEGVERLEQLEELRTLGCNLVQGYYFYRPMPPEDLVELVCQQQSAATDLQEPLYYLIYMSRAHDVLDMDMLDAVLEQSHRRNRLVGITGCLLVQGCVFMQFLEGPREAVIETFERIRNDSRHDRIFVVDQGEQSERLFSEWFMQCRRLDTDIPFDSGIGNDPIQPRLSLLELGFDRRACYAFMAAHAGNAADENRSELS